MTAGLFKFVKNLLLPNGFFVLAILILPPLSALPQNLWPYAHYYPYILYATAGALCWRFHKDRYLFAILSIALSERALYHLVAGGGQLMQTGMSLQSGIGILLPLNLTFFEIIRDRGIFTLWGIGRWLLLGGQFLLLSFIYCNPASPLSTVIQAELIRLHHYFPGSFIDPVTVAFLFSLLILTTRLLFNQKQFESTTVWCLILLFLGIHHTKDMALMTYFASSTSLLFIATILETSYRLAYFDELTGLPARRALNEQLKRLGSKYAIAMVDIDYFKKFNDRFGHDAGDQVLKMVASRLKGVGGRGRSFRYGGEEFAIIFPGATLKGAKPCLESLRERIASTKFTLRGLGRAMNKPTGKNKADQKSVRITVSIGLAEKTESYPDAQAVIKAADKALYRAKKSGRNRVCA